jgi:hypothetical protein
MHNDTRSTIYKKSKIRGRKNVGCFWPTIGITLNSPGPLSISKSCDSFLAWAFFQRNIRCIFKNVSSVKKNFQRMSSQPQHKITPKLRGFTEKREILLSRFVTSCYYGSLFFPGTLLRIFYGIPSLMSHFIVFFCIQSATAVQGVP